MFPDSPFMKVAKDKYFEYCDRFEVISEFLYGFVRQHKSITPKHPDYELLRTISCEKAQRGAIVDIMPVLHPKDAERLLIFPDAKLNKNPDLRINGTLHEVKTATNPLHANNLKHAIEQASNQADHVIINVPEPLFIGYVYRIANSKFLAHKHLKLIEIRYRGYWLSADREKVTSLYESMK